MASDRLNSALARDVDGAFEELVTTFQHRLYAFAVTLCGDRALAEDIGQDAFVRAYRALKRYEAGRIASMSLKPWLYRITLNVFRNRARKKQGTQVVLMEQPPDSEADPALGPEPMLLRSAEQQELAAAIRRLPEIYRTAVVLKYVQELSYSEIAETLGQPLGTVKAKVHRGLELLRRSYLREVS